jgi:5-methyltetrahydrofolate--homocysteine methyltransferase
MINNTPLYQAVLTGDATAARSNTEQELAKGADPLSLVTGQMTPAMAEVGRRFESGEFFMPELLLAARAMKASMEILRPLLADCNHKPIGRVVIGTAKGDLHDVGKNLVGAMMEGGGFEVTDLGVDVSPEAFINAAQEKQADLISISALLTTTMMGMKNTIMALEKAGLSEPVKVMVGGAPITPQFAEKIGADGYASNAVEAVKVAKQLLKIA